MSIPDRDILDLIGEAVARQPADMDLIDELLKRAQLQGCSTSYFLDICSIIRRLPNAEELARHWFRHAVECARDWREQYLAVRYAKRRLQDQNSADWAFGARPWLADLGFGCSHGFDADFDDPEQVVLVSPSGICGHEPPFPIDSSARTVDAAIRSVPCVGVRGVVVVMRPGAYECGVNAYNSAVTLLGIGGRTSTSIDLGAGQTVTAGPYGLYVHGLTIRRTSNDGARLPAIGLFGLSDVVLSDCEIRNHGGAALATLEDHGESIRIENSLIADCVTGLAVATGLLEVRATSFADVSGEAIAMKVGKAPGYDCMELSARLGNSSER